MFAGLALGCFWRMHHLSRVLLFGDENHTLPMLAQGYGAIARQFDAFGSHVVLPMLQRASCDLFGPSMTSFRLPALVPGMAVLLLCYPVAKGLVGPAPALLATMALAASSIHIFYSRFARSYALVMLLGLLFVGALLRALDPSPRSRLWWVGAALAAALLAYTHLTSLAFLLGIGVAAAVSSLSSPERGRALRTLLAVYLLGGVLCLGLYLPIWGPLRTYLAAIPEGRDATPIDWIGVLALLAGGHAAAITWACAIPIAIVAIVRARRAAGALILAAGVAGPLLFVLAARPPGREYAYARYLLIALPYILMLLAWLLVTLAQRLVGRGRAAARGALAVGVALIVALHLSGPRSPLRAGDGPFENTYLGLHPLPAFDQPFPAMPRFYETLAKEPDSIRIIETPPRLFRAALLYRNYFLRHRKETLVGWPADDLAPLLGGPNVRLDDPLLAERSGAAYVVLHKNVAAECVDYFRFVYTTAWPAVRGRSDAGFMEHHNRTVPIGPEPARLAQRLSEEMRRRFGEPIYEDDLIFVWSLRGESSTPAAERAPGETDAPRGEASSTREAS